MKSLKYIKRTWPLFFFATFFSCGDECGSPPPVPVISYDDPVYEGDYLVMTARGGTDHIYTWSGPNNFSAEGRIQEFENVQVFHSGDYVVTVQEDGCSGITNTNKLTVFASTYTLYAFGKCASIRRCSNYYAGCQPNL